MLYIKKPIAVEAVHFSVDDGFSEVPEWLCAAVDSETVMLNSAGVVVETLEGTHFSVDDCYIVRGVEGELYPVKGDIFRKTYEPVDAV